MRAIEAVTAKGETSALCQSIGVSRAPSPRALVPAERRAVRDTLHSARFVDQSPAEVYATLLEEQTYLCSPRTMYRVLAEADEVRERRDQVRHPAYVKPELVATAPNQVWSWDITKLKGPVPYLYYSLYVILDLFSRYVVGWMVAVKESAHLAERLIEQTCAKQRIQPQQLTIHADRGAPMRSKLVALLFSDLGIAASHSRPRVSNDNPFSAAQFRTFKYRPAAIERRVLRPQNLNSAIDVLTVRQRVIELRANDVPQSLECAPTVTGDLRAWCTFSSPGTSIDVPRTGQIVGCDIAVRAAGDGHHGLGIPSHLLTPGPWLVAALGLRPAGDFCLADDDEPCLAY